jgi:hypothetical protein
MARFGPLDAYREVNDSGTDVSKSLEIVDEGTLFHSKSQYIHD